MVVFLHFSFLIHTKKKNLIVDSKFTVYYLDLHTFFIFCGGQAMSYDQIMQRIRFVTRTRTQVELAAILGIKQSSISDGKRRQNIPSDWYMKLFENLGVNPDWLKKGIGPIYLRTEEGYCSSNRELQATNSNFLTGSFVRSEIVKVYSMHSNYTKETLLLTEDNCIEEIVIPKSYAKNSIIVFQTYNDEALPLVRKNSYIGIDTSSICPTSGEFFAINIPYEGIVLRKIFWNQEEKRFILRSENAEFPQISISLEQKEYILGRLCWVMQKI